MNHHEVNKVTHLTPPGGSHDLVHGQINWMQDIPKGLSAHRWERPVIAVHDPFQACAGVAVCDPRRYRAGVIAVTPSSRSWNTSMSSEYRAVFREKPEHVDLHVR